ncbi:UV-damage endonuclease [Choanephora cucurbitarum]|uniref:UV-damage endonuclease n=1 Tax=Choanephora cucurbitarum TaxID=101091 RepID=A0A1C7N4I6_9FUNG|nr:UV-damage endonuclease [Choanephora cucurbitarum]
MNTVLRHQKPPIFSARTCRLGKHSAVYSVLVSKYIYSRLDTVRKKGLDYVKELALANVADMKKMIQWNEDNKIKFMRISSEMFPFASHQQVGYDISFAEKELKDVGDLANKYNHRLTMHPGQFNQLVSLNPNVVTNTVRELDYHARMLDLMGMNQDSVMIIHMGGVYGDKASAIARFEKEYEQLPEHIKRRLVLENDELGYSVSDLLPVCKRLKIPLVLDWHHHHINPGDITDLVALLPEINQVWYDKGIKPKQHYSESRRGAKTAVEMRAHSDRVKYLPPTTDDVDLMIEAKDKEQAVFELYKLYNLEIVADDVWVPKKGTETLETKGRKSQKAAKKRKAKEEEETKSEEIKVEMQEEQLITQPNKRTSRRSAAAAADLKRKEAEVEAIQTATELVEEQEGGRTRRSKRKASLVAERKLTKKSRSRSIRQTVKQEVKQEASDAILASSHQEDSQVPAEITSSAPAGYASHTVINPLPAAESSAGVTDANPIPAPMDLPNDK